jgi:multiple sugar transport system substrate-binding protein
VQSKAGVGPDVFDFWGQASFDSYVESGIALDLTDALKEHGINFEKEVWPLALPWTMKKGRVFAVPANVGTDAMWFHKDLFQKAGVPFPRQGWTMAEFLETAQKLTIRDANGKVSQFGVLIDVGGMFNLMLGSYGGNYWTKDGTECILDSPEAIECLTLVQDLLYKYKVAPTPQDETSITSGGGWGGGAGAMAYFRRKTGAMAIGGRWWLAQLRDDVKLNGYQLGSVTLPIAKYDRFSGNGTRAVIVNAMSPHRKEAIEFVAYLMKGPYNQLLNEQADALSGVRSAAYTPDYEKNPRDPGQDFHLAFRKQLEKGFLLETSPFLTQSEFDLMLNRQLDLVKLNMKTPAQALKAAKRDIMDAMRRWVNRNPQLKAEYDRRVAARA